MTMPIHPLAAGVLVGATLISGAATMVAEFQDTRPAGGAGQSQADPKRNVDRPPASPTSSVDMPSRDIAPPHKRPLVMRDGRTLLWAGGHPQGGPGAIWFDMTDALVDPAKFQFGIGKDRIPSIDEPRFANLGDPALAAARIGDQTDVIGFVAGGVAKAYPLFILDRHEIVNDEFAGSPYGVYW